MSERATCWSITINNPTQDDHNECAEESLPAGWAIEGQPEIGEKNGTPHLQLMLTTPQVRRAAVKKHFKRAHIEVARNPKALQKYVNKEETRAGEKIKAESAIPTIFQYQGIIAARWDWDEFKEYIAEYNKQFPHKLPNEDELAMRYLDSLVAEDIEQGRRGPEWIATNPMWINSWKKFWRSIIKRHASSQCEHSSQSGSSEEGPPVSSPGAQAAQAEQCEGVCVGEADAATR